MSEENKRIVANETWTARDFSSLAGPHDQGHPVAVAMAEVAACAPEALRMLERLEWSGNEGGWDYSACCVADCGAYPSAPKHSDSCPWLALMRKAGLR